MLKVIYAMLVIMLGLTGCSIKTQPPVKKTTPKPINIQKPKVIEKPIQKTTKAKEVVKKPVPTYAHCDKHKKITTHAYTYVVKEFNEAYFVKKDLKGAQAQLFLIETKSPTSFAKNINAAQSSYINNYHLAKKNGCDLTKYKPSPLDQVKKNVLALEKVSATKK